MSEMTPAVAAAPRAYPWPTLALLFAVLGMGLSAILVRWANAPGPVSGFYRMLIALALLGAPFAAEVRRRPLRAGPAAAFAVLAGLCFAGDLAFWNTSVLMTSAANATFLGNTAPVWVGVGALLFFREKLRPAFWLGLAVALAGAAALLGGDFRSGADTGLGSVFALIAGFFYAGFFLATQRAREGLSALASWWLSALFSALALLGVSGLLGQPLLGYPTSTYLALAASAVVTQVAGYLLVNYALGHLPAPIVSATLLLQPIVTIVAGIALLGEWPTPIDLLGGLLLLAGVAIANRYGR